MIEAHPSRLFLAAVLVLVLVRPCSTVVAQTNDVQPLIAANTAFALDLYSQLKVSDGNLFFSPYSISTCLAMASAGARGDTEKQMARVLHFGGMENQLHSASGALQKQLLEAQKTNEFELRLANALWVQKSFSFLPAFRNLVRQDYGANVSEVDFCRHAEAARQTLNQWAGVQTRGRITGLIPMGMLDQATRLVLANAIFFKGAWASPFKTNLTATQPFHVSMYRHVVVPFMHQVGPAGYFSSPAFQAVRLPYANGEISMVILLPRQIADLWKTENALTSQSLSQCLGEMKNQEVDISLPRLKLEIDFELSFILSKMGMPDAFKSRADFSGMDGSRDLFISGFFHKAGLEVNEAGTKAAASTAIALTPTGPVPTPPVFRADHPFVFLIRDDRSGTILFLGRVNDPSPPQ